MEETPQNKPKSEDFRPKESKFTIVYDKEGNEIERFDEFVTIDPKKYDAFMPISYKQIIVTTQVVSSVKIDKKKEES